MRLRLFVLGVFTLLSMRGVAHSDVEEHVKDMRAVFGFQDGRAGAKNAEIVKWMKFISSDMIDKKEFHDSLKIKCGFDCTSPKLHRLLFHWGYNSKPWNDALERRVRRFARDNKIQEDSIVTVIKEKVRTEQKRRNRKVNEMTEDLFGFAHGGTAARFANFFASIAYDVHLIGDYMTDNSCLEGLQGLDSVVGDMVNRIRAVDNIKGKNIIRGITAINMESGDVQKKADKLMAYLKQEMPRFIKEAREGNIYRILKSNGVVFEE